MVGSPNTVAWPTAMAARTLESHLTNHASPEEIAAALAELNEAIQAALEPGEAALLAWLTPGANSLTH